MKLILTDGTELTPILVTGESQYVQGANRDTLTFVFGDVSMDEIDAAFTEANCETIQLVTEQEVEVTNEDGTTETNTVENVDVHEGYVIRSNMKKYAEKVQDETTNTAAVYENRVTISMSQRTYSETKMVEMQAQNDLLTECILELSAEVYGE